MGLKVWTLFMNLSYKNFQDFILFQLSDFAHWVYFNNKSYKSLLRDSISRPIAPQWQAETKTTKPGRLGTHWVGFIWAAH
jgi:hypothetical protein